MHKCWQWWGGGERGITPWHHCHHPHCCWALGLAGLKPHALPLAQIVLLLPPPLLLLGPGSGQDAAPCPLLLACASHAPQQVAYASSCFHSLPIKLSTWIGMKSSEGLGFRCFWKHFPNFSVEDFLYSSSNHSSQNKAFDFRLESLPFTGILSEIIFSIFTLLETSWSGGGKSFCHLKLLVLRCLALEF